MKIFLKPLLALKTKRGYSIFSAVVVTLFSAWAISDALKIEVVIAADDETEKVRTHFKTVGELLEELGITVNEHDHLSHSVNTQLEDGMEILLKTAKKITLIIDGKENKYYTIAD